MFFTYPISATADNWISSTLLDVLRNALEVLQRGEEPPEFQDAVPEIYRPEFSRGRKFPELFKSFVDTCRPLDAQQRDLVLAALASQNHFPDLFDVGSPSPSIADTLPTIHGAARELFEYAFGKLSDLKAPGSHNTIRARYHKLVHDHIESGCCPFCGLEILEAPDPDLVKPDLDHYLAISKYPFAGVNLRNLTAMGTTCNRSYKGAQDILLDELNQRAACMDPYGNDRVTVSLDGTVLLPGEGQGPAWNMVFDPDARSRNWRRVFNLEARLTSNLLDKQYQIWLKQFVSYIRKNRLDITSLDGAVEAVRKFKDTCEFETFPTIARLKSCFFGLIEEELNDASGGDRMHNFVTALTRV